MQKPSVKVAPSERLGLDSSPQAGRGRRTSLLLSPGVVGVLAFLVVLALRFVGVFVGPLAVILGIACLLLVPGPSRLSDRLLIFFAIGFGWLPLLGWIPDLGTTVDVPGILLALSAGVACAHQVRRRRARARIVLAAPLRVETVALVVAGVATLWWALPVARLKLTGKLHLLFAGWDNSSHFDIFRQNILLGSFISDHSQAPGGGQRLLWDYPQGVYQAWAQLARLWSPNLSHGTGSILNGYVAILIVTLAAIILVACMNVARLCRSDPWVALPAMAVVVQVFVFGRLWIFNGYPNFAVAVTATALAVSMAWRPTMSPRLSFLVIAGLALVAAYTWYPLLFLGVPALVVASLRLTNTTPRGSRSLVNVAYVATALALAAPILFFAHRGISTLSSGLGVDVAVWTPGTPWGLVVLTVGALLAFTLAYQAIRPDAMGTVVLAGLVVLGGVGVIFVSAVALSSSHSVTYYGQKYATGVFAICLVVLASVSVCAVANSAIRRRASKSLIAAAAVLASVAVVQFDGYVGPFASAIQATVASGYSFHQALGRSPKQSGVAQELLAAAQIAENQMRGPQGLKEHWWYFQPNIQLTCAETEEWFSVLSGEPTVQQYTMSFMFPCGNGRGTAQSVAFILKNFPDPVANHTHLFVPRSLARRLIARDPAWRAPDALMILR